MRVRICPCVMYLHVSCLSIQAYYSSTTVRPYCSSHTPGNNRAKKGD